jgi:phosphohistidine phosphatase
LVIRHAKSDQSFLLNDFDRPLNDRGKKDAPEMAKRILKKKLAIDSFICSPANRAKTTAQLFAKEFEVKNIEITLVPTLYHADPDTFFKVIESLPDDVNSVAVFSHNPGITHFVNQLCSHTRIDNMPTCGVFAATIKTETWKDFKTAEKKMLFFDWPKNN